MRDTNHIFLSCTVLTEPRSFGGDGTASGCEINVVVHDEWKNADGTPGHREDFFGVVAYGPVTKRALTLNVGDRIMVTGTLRSESLPKTDGKLERKTKVRANSIEHLRRITLAKE